MSPFRVTAAILLLSLAAGLRADTLVRRDGTRVEAQVTGIADGKVALQAGGPLALADLRTWRHDAFAVASRPRGIVLRDGTRLCGIWRKLTPQTIEFRSVTFGALTMPLEQVAAVYYQAPEPGSALRAGQAAAVLQADGTRQEGQFMWADEASVGLLTTAGLKKLPAAGVTLVVLRDVTVAGNLRLRNGDCLAAVKNYAGDSLELDIAGKQMSLPLKAVAELNLQ